MSLFSAVPSFVGNLSWFHWLGVLAVLALWFYHWCTKEFGVFERKGLFSIKPVFGFGNQWAMFSGGETFDQYHRNIYNKFKENGKK